MAYKVSYVATAEEYQAALKDVNVHYIRLTADIDLKGKKNPISDKYYHSIDVWKDISGVKKRYVVGQEYPYYTIKNQDYNIYRISGMKMHNLVIENMTGKFARATYNCTFDEMIFLNCKEDQNSGCIISDYDHYGKLSNLSFSGCTVFDKEGAGLLFEKKAGGYIKNCVIKANCAVYGGGKYTGGFVGWASCITIEDCVNYGMVMSYDNNLGGLVGQCFRSDISTSKFFGMVKHVKFGSESNFIDMIEGWFGLLGTAFHEKTSALYNIYTYADMAYSTYKLADVNNFFNSIYIMSSDLCWVDETMCTAMLTDGMMNKAIYYGLGVGIPRIRIAKCLSRYFWDPVKHVFTGSEIVEWVNTANTMLPILATFELAWSAYCLYAFAMNTVEIFNGLSGPDNVGGIAGKACFGSIKKCVCYGHVEGRDANVGGIVGQTESGCQIVNCYNHGVVRGGEKVGGIVGLLDGSTVKTSLNIGTISCSDQSTAGRIYGKKKNTCTLLYNCYSDTISDIGSSKTDLLRFSQKDFVSGKATYYLNKYSFSQNGKKDTVWYQKVGKGYWPTQTKTGDSMFVSKNGNNIDESLSTTLKISTKEDLSCALANPYSDISIMNDINFSSETSFCYCSKYMPFCGRIEGNGHTISNISYTQSGKVFNFKGLESLWTSIGHIGLIGTAQNATFRNLTLKNINLDMNTNVTNVGLFCGHSRNCVFDNIHITGSSAITESDGEKHYEEIIGGLVGGSEYDTIRNCSVGPGCTIFSSGCSVGTGDDDYSLQGGIVGWAKNTYIANCFNSAKVRLRTANSYLGGIAGRVDNCTLVNCLNNGVVRGYEYEGGIAGFAKNSYVTKCVNTGTLESCGYTWNKSGTEKVTGLRFAGGIVGRTYTNDNCITYCMNFGNISHSASPIASVDKSSRLGAGNYYYCSIKGEHKDNDNAADGSFYKYSAMTSGAAALNLTDADGNTWLHQDLDNNTYYTHFPVPDPDAGTVYSNILCDNATGTQSYSNIYKGTSGHTCTPDSYGRCSTCGRLTSSTTGSVIHIKDSLELINFSNAVNSGVDFTNTTVYLDNDINLDSCNFPVIGRYATHPFRGTFDGQGHRIKNMIVSLHEGCIGFFGVVSGNSIIRNLIIDSSCSVFTNNGTGVAGLIGGVKPYNGVAANVTIENCGNEASVNGCENVAGLLGGVYENDNNVVNINNCYNTGAIGGESKTKCGSIVGYARLHTNISNTYNSGTVGGTTDWLTFAYTDKDGFDGTISNCYTTVSGDKSPRGVSKISSSMVSSGELCTLLNKNSIVFSQNVLTESYPMPGTEGLSGSSSLHIKDAQELMAFADSVNAGISYNNKIIYLDNDIDLGDATKSLDNPDFKMIGYYSDKPFIGTFDGLGHRIKNMTIKMARGCLGLFGSVAGTNTTIRNVIIDSSCSVISTATKKSDSYSGVAGLVGCVTTYNSVASNVTIENCGNEAAISGYNNVAGVLGGVYNSYQQHLTIRNCYNTGAISGSKSAATLCGWASAIYTITNCYNSGSLSGGESSRSLYCYSSESGAKLVSNCYDVNDSQTGVTEIDACQVSPGELCQLLNKDSVVFSQDLSTYNHPIPGNEGLTNYTQLHITDAAGLVDFANTVNSGTSYAGATVYLDNDIDLSAYTGDNQFPVIGRWRDKPFRGTFDGQGHRIMNMALNYKEGGIGLFGCVAGVCTIKNTIIDASSSVTVTSTGGTGFAALVGKSEDYDSYNLITVENCGNEAAVSGKENTAGIFGKIFDSHETNTKLHITNCYNTGAISGSKNSATICGWAYKNLCITNCYNSGSIKGKAGSDYLFRYNHDGTLKATNCYDVNGTQTGVAKISASQVKSGDLCSMLNSNDTVYTQNVTSDLHPLLGTEGLTGITNLFISTPEELIAFADTVNSGTKDYLGSYICLTSDIDLSGYTQFTGIGGGSGSIPFRGMFDGQGHRIKNWTVNYKNEGTGHGFFRRVSGTNCIVKNLVIDSSCSITVEGDYPGAAGIVGFVTSESGTVCNVTIENCGNEATITDEDNAAGILGGVYNNTNTNLTITNCYNTGAIKGEYHSATLCAVCNSNFTFTNCYNSGSLTGVRDDNYLYYKGDGSGSVINCFDINHDGSGVSKVSSEMVTDGELCRLLDTPDTVYSQVIGTDTHPVFGTTGVSNAPTLHITTADELVTFANNVNNGNSYGSYTVYLDNDIDLSDISFPVIGRWHAKPFRGTFDGQYHRIKNMTLNFDEGGIGLFGCIAGSCTIRNTILDSSCSVTSTSGTGVAGLVGKVQSYTTDNVITIQNCGNEASVKGEVNAAGILGTIWSDTNTHLTITNCYNTGAINGTEESASICGYAHDNYSITNCFNTGTLSGVDGSNTLFRYGSDGTASVSNCYDVNGSQDGVTLLTEDQMRLGYLCQQLHNNTEDGDVWVQDISTDNIPTFVTTVASEDTTVVTGVHYSRSMESQWGTVCLPFTARAGDDYELYKVASISGNALMLEEVDTLEAGNAALIHRKSIAVNTGEGFTDVDILPIDSVSYIEAPVVDYSGDVSLVGVFSQKSIRDINAYKLADSYFEYKAQNTDARAMLAIALASASSICDPYHAYLTTTLSDTPNTLYLNSGISFIIDNAEQFIDFSNAVNEGLDLSTATVQLSSDIDFADMITTDSISDEGDPVEVSAVSLFEPVGTTDYPFFGSFDGQGHRIKNLAIKGENYTGLFGLVGGADKTVNVNIKNVIIDSSCSNISTGTGVAGLIGCVTSTSGRICNINLENCGNEADITSDRNVGGIMGAVFNNDNTVVNMNNCYNTGAITGRTLVSALGYVRQNYNIANCYNSGTLTATKNTPSLYRVDETVGTTSVTNCYDITGTQTGVTLTTADQVASGELCFLLNGNKAEGAWGHTSAYTHPIPNGAGMQHYSRTMQNQYETICLPFAATVSGDFNFYTVAAIDGDVLTLNEVAAVQAGEPVIIHCGSASPTIAVEGDGTAFAEAPLSGSSVDGITLTGTFLGKDVTDEDGYIIANNAFWRIAEIKDDDKVYCSPFAAYFVGTVAGVKQFKIGYDGETSINALIDVQDAGIYDLNGRRLNDLQKGVNIMKLSNGATRKIIIR